MGVLVNSLEKLRLSLRKARRVVCFSLLVLAFFVRTPAFAQGAPSLSDAATIRVSSRLVILDALVENRSNGEAVGDLQPRDFLLLEDGVPQTITYFSQDRLPLSVVFLFDLTDTVRSALEPLAEGAREVLGHLKPEDEVAIWSSPRTPSCCSLSRPTARWRGPRSPGQPI
jgi:hypothetical protein